jgi:hypothetical protein
MAEKDRIQSITTKVRLRMTYQEEAKAGARGGGFGLLKREPWLMNE